MYIFDILLKPFQVKTQYFLLKLLDFTTVTVQVKKKLKISAIEIVINEFSTLIKLNLIFHIMLNIKKLFTPKLKCLTMQF